MKLLLLVHVTSCSYLTTFEIPGLHGTQGTAHGVSTACHWDVAPDVEFVVKMRASCVLTANIDPHALEERYRRLNQGSETFMRINIENPYEICAFIVPGYIDCSQPGCE